MDDKALIYGCRKNRRKAQNELFRRYQNTVMVICKRYGGAERANDFFQESFIQIFKSLAKKQHIESLQSWVAKVAINTCIKYYHQHQRNDLLDLTDECPISYEDLEIIERLSIEQVFEVINELPPGYRVIFNLYYVDGYGHKEIGDLLGITASTSRSQLTRAKHHLKQKLESIGIFKYEI